MRPGLPRTCHEKPSLQGRKRHKDFRLGGFSVSQFYLDKPQGLPLIQAHLLASSYIDGQWFDVHISMGGTELPDQSSLMELLKAISIK